MTTQTLSPFPSAFPPRPPLAHARLDADGAKNLPLWTAPSLWRALSPLPAATHSFGPSAETASADPARIPPPFPCGDFP